MNQLINTKVRVGKKLAKQNGEILGNGLYVLDQYVYTSKMGRIISPKPNYFQVSNSLPYNKAVGVKIGSIVYAKDQSLVEILQVDGTTMSKGIEGTIRRQHIREKMIDRVTVVESFKPNDIVRAKVISMGDSIRSLYLSTSGEDFGVVIGVCEETKRVMLPFDWSSMVDVEAGIKQIRKVAKPQM